MIRYFLNATGCCDSQSADMDVSDNGDYYRVEDVDPIIADRDIKAANLKSLVDMVLEYKAAFNNFMCGAGTSAELGAADDAMTNLARGLKQ